ncbi:MAG: NUDIX domain-containing protein, partial [Chloroflexi bacterium]|nr:NUDIX domain-containing protein [Chloroflexota bacterium]
MPERTVSSRRAFTGRLLSLRIDEVALESGRRATREVVEHPGAVAILAWDGERLAAVRQWRQAAAAELLEIPAGTREPGESPQETAQREL